MLIASENSLTDRAGTVFDQISRHPVDQSSKVTHKVNHHI